MVRTCDCHGRCDGGDDISRREFLQTASWMAGAAAAPTELWMAGAGDQLPKAPRRARGDEQTQTPRTYRGPQLAGVAMPIGGIGTGSVWLDGYGRLSTWQIQNNQTEERIPDSFLALRVEPEDGPPVVRVLQLVGEQGLSPMAELSYEGGYPIARLTLTDPELPVEVLIEGYNPLAPLDTFHSSLPCALFRVTVRNTGARPLRATVVGTLQNAIGWGGHAGVEHTRFWRYGGNRNRVLARPGRALVAMERNNAPPAAGMLQLDNAVVPTAPILWLDTLATLEQSNPRRADGAEGVAALARVARDGGIAVAAGVGPAFLQEVAAYRANLGQPLEHILFADFEADHYGGWTATGEAFGAGPVAGTLPTQNHVSGFFGNRLVNSFQPNDATVGTLVSPPFVIERRYIGFLIGGGYHPGQTCVNLMVDGAVARTATGHNGEDLRPVVWDVAELRGKTAVIAIVDAHTGTWGHVNVDHIVFSEQPPHPLLGTGTPGALMANELALHVKEAETMQCAPQARVVPTPRAPAGFEEPWRVDGYTRIRVDAEGLGPFRVIAQTAEGDPIALAGPLGKGHLTLFLAAGPPWSWVRAAIGSARGAPLGDAEVLRSADPAEGTMALVAFDRRAKATAHWSDGVYLAAQLRNHPTLPAVDDTGYSPQGQTYNAAVCVPMRLGAGRASTTTLGCTWHFPNAERFDHLGNAYCAPFADAVAVADYLHAHHAALWEQTRLFHRTAYASNLPEEFLDAITANITILRSQTCWRSADGYFAGYEGCYRCCPLNCTHVWNYAQTHARLFPELDRNMRVSDLLVYLHDSGETSHRQHAPHNAFIDGHCAAILGALRAHQTSPDRRFLERIWPAVKKATDWLIGAIDADRDGVPAGHQWNTYDCAVSGANTFIGSQYLAALTAAAALADAMGEPALAADYRALAALGRRNQTERLFNGEYFIQTPETPPAHDYNTGCHSDQLLGQWWAHQTDLGYLYDPAHVRSALDAIIRHNLRANFVGFQQAPRRYCLDNEGGLLMCTWPQGGRPDPFIIYADEVWTGIEYAVAAALVYEGKLEAARRVVTTARARYDGVPRDGVNSGPGGNPFNELECGRFYARAMSSWSLLTAAQGFVCDTPRGLLGFLPRWQPEDHRSLFVAGECWGLYTRAGALNRVEVRHGRLRLRELMVLPPAGAGPLEARVAAGGRRIAARAEEHDNRVRLALDREVHVHEGETVEAEVSRVAGRV